MPPYPPIQVEKQIQRKRKNKAAAKEALEAYGRRKDFLQQLPLELLLQVLSYSTSITILSVARTCKWLFNTVADPAHAFVWKAARRHLLDEAVPDPTSNIPEIAYASILFDGGPCLGCQKQVRHPPFDFYHRVWICDDPKCAAELKLQYIPLNVMMGALDFDEYEFYPGFLSCPGDGMLMPSMYLTIDETTLPGPSFFKTERNSLVREWMASEQDPHQRDLLMIKLTTLTRRLTSAHSHRDLYRRWRRKRQRRVTAAESVNRNIFYDIARRWSQDSRDVKKSPSLRHLVKICEREQEAFTEEILHPQAEMVVQQVEDAKAKRLNREKEHHRALRQEAVERFWMDCRSGTVLRNDLPSGLSIPTLGTFRQLPSVRRIEQTGDHKTLSATLRKDATLHRMVAQDLVEWTASIRKVLGMRLELKGKWKPPPKGEQLLHPLDRITALFQCQRCHRTGRKSSQKGALDFRDVVQHRCPPSTLVPIKGKEKFKQERDWSVDNFVVDNIAAAAARVALLAAKLNEQKTDKQDIARYKYQWQCLVCPSRVTMEYGSLIGHAQRHSLATQEFKVALLPDNDPSIFLREPCADIEFYMSDTKAAGHVRSRKTFTCRHCHFSAVAQTAPNAPKIKLAEKALDWNGVTSHLYSKHGLRPPRSEDIHWIAIGEGDDDQTAHIEKDSWE